MTYDNETTDAYNGRHVLNVYSLNGKKLYGFVINKIKTFDGGVCMAFDNKGKLIAAETFLYKELNNTDSVLLNFINQLYWFYKQNSAMFSSRMFRSR